jgi:hypothetical protein
VASEPDGSNSKDEFKKGSTTLAELTSAPYLYIWDDVDTGTYLITAVATDDFGAATTSSVMEVRVDAFYNANSEIINLYPNPNNGHFSIDIYSGLHDQNNRVTIVSISGNTIYNEILKEQDSYREFDLSDKASGTYILMVTSDNAIVSTRKFIKK